jgi:hypothetical protein
LLNGKPKQIMLNENQKSELELGHKKGKQNAYRQPCHYVLLNAESYEIQDIAKIYKKAVKR